MTEGGAIGGTTMGTTDGVWVEVRRGVYHDSVTLMRVSRALAERPDVAEAMAAMGTDLNLEMLRRMGFDVPADAGPGDLVVAVRAAEGAPAGAVDDARRALEALLRRPATP
ncbi:MAG: hypothetical protein IRY90_05405, partial [Actinomadura rubrobrunea]|nr:hypothetical protein [Actinomadura rubrobrunea]